MELQQHRFLAHLHDPETEDWDDIRAATMRIEQEAFGAGAFEEDYLRMEFEATENVAVLLCGDNLHVAGFTVAGPIERYNDNRWKDACQTAYVSDTVIEREYRGRGLVAVMMNVLEEDLRRRGYRFVERHAAVENGYAGAILRAYGDRVIAKDGPANSEWGPQTFFRIRL